MEDGVPGDIRQAQTDTIRVTIRTLDGQSLVLQMHPDNTIQQLKTKLHQMQWPPCDASISVGLRSSPSLSPALHLHIYHKGKKITKDSKLKELGFLESEFLVCIPYSKKKTTEHLPFNSSPVPQVRLNSTDAEAAVLGETRQKRKLSKDGKVAIERETIDIAGAGPVKNPKPPETPGPESGGGGEVTEHSTFSSCIERKQKLNRSNTKRASLSSLFPPALERLNKVFDNLNMIYGFLQKQHMQTTWHNVKQALQDLCAAGEVVTLKDIETLATLCPKVVLLSCMSGEREDASFYINLVGSSKDRPNMEDKNKCVLLPDDARTFAPSDLIPNSGRKSISDRVVRNAIDRRRSAFEEGIREVVKASEMKACTANEEFDLKDVALEDLLSTAKIVLEGCVTQDKKSALPRPPRLHKELTRCTKVNHLSTKEMVDHLEKKFGCLGQIVHCEYLPPRAPVYGQLVCDLLNPTQAALEKIGIKQLYRHQAEAIDAAISMTSVVIATSTASGKSICYNVPVLEQLLRIPESCALYLFPTKALAQDQLRSLEEFTKDISTQFVMGLYDGDTIHKQRLFLRDHARLIISNPDMLHMSILPLHRQFVRFLSNLRYVVIDEAHAYRGAFGCHTALILRRLRRLCRHLYGTEPVFIICSATVANPREHAMELVGLRQLQVVQDDGSPSGGKYFLLWNPPLSFLLPRKNKISRKQRKLNHPPSDVQTQRTSPVVEVASLLAEMVQHGLRCIAFCKTRKLCELVLNYTREILKETSCDLIDTIRAYRAGYTAKERRAIESDLFDGRLHGVASTNALELGIDVGSLDVTLHLGFPGTVASLWQQAGRAGRREKPSLSIYVAFGSPLDQHFMKHPHKLFSQPIELAQVDAYNYQVLEQQLTCAAYEYPLHVPHDEEYFGSGLPRVVMDLVKKGFIGRHPTDGPEEKIWSYIGVEELPSAGISIRGIDPEKYTVINKRTNEIIEEIEANKAFFQVYEGAVYIHQGKTYLVESLDLAEKVALCYQADVKYYTKTRDFTDVHVLGGDLAYPRKVPTFNYPTTTAQASMCKVTTRWIGFRRIWQGSNETFDSVDLFLPPVSYDSQAAWIRVPHEIRQNLQKQGLPFRAGLHAASHALLNVMPLYIMCNSSDLGTECAHPQDTRYYPERLLVFDRHSGGFGIAVQVMIV